MIKYGEYLGTEEERNGGRQYRTVKNVYNGTTSAHGAFVYDDEEKENVTRPATAKLLNLAGIAHNPDIEKDEEDSTYTKTLNQELKICVDGKCKALVEGTVAIASGDVLKPVNGQFYLTKDTDYDYDVVIPLNVSDTASALVAATSKASFVAPFAFTIDRVDASVAVAATGTGSVTFDVNKNGTTIFTTQANRPIIPVTEFKHIGTVAPDVTAVAAGDLITIDTDVIGGTLPGESGCVTIKGHRGAKLMTKQEKYGTAHVIALEAYSTAAQDIIEVNVVRNKE